MDKNNSCRNIKPHMKHQILYTYCKIVFEQYRITYPAKRKWVCGIENLSYHDTCVFFKARMETWRWNHHNVENTTSAKYKMSYRHDWTYPYGVIPEKVANKRSKMDDKSNTQWKPPATVSIATDFTIQDTADIQKENTDLQDYYWTPLEAMLRA